MYKHKPVLTEYKFSVTLCILYHNFKQLYFLLHITKNELFQVFLFSIIQFHLTENKCDLEQKKFVMKRVYENHS